MEEDFATFVFVIVSVACVILWIIILVKFFALVKNVAEIRGILASEYTKEKQGKAAAPRATGMQVGAIVVAKKSQKQMKITDINDGIYTCKSGIVEETYKADDLMTWEEFSAAQK